MEVSIAERGSHLARADAEASVEALFADCDARRQQLGQQTWQGQPEGGTAEAPKAEVSAEPPKKQFKEAAKAARIQKMNNAKERRKLDKLLLGDPESKDQATKDGLQQTVVNARPLARVLRGLILGLPVPHAVLLALPGGCKKPGPRVSPRRWPHSASMFC